jgi:hypothetical protein
MAFQAAIVLLGIAGDAGFAGEFDSRVGGGQDRIGLGVLRSAPDAELEVDLRPGMAGGARHDAGVTERAGA